MVYTNLTLCGSTFTEGDFISDIVGSISTVGIKTNILVVNMTMKGSGYVQDFERFDPAPCQHQPELHQQGRPHRIEFRGDNHRHKSRDRPGPCVRVWVPDE